LEFRSAGELTGDEQVMDDVLNNADIHAYTASIIFPNDEDRARARQNSKAHTFKPLYGGESGTKSEREYYAAFKQKYHKVTEAQNKWVELALKSKKLTTLTGLTFYFPDITYTRSGYIQGNTKVRDYPIQYFATGEVVPIGVMSLWRRMKSTKLRSYLQNTIHDSIVTATFPTEKELINELALQSLIEDVKTYMSRVYDIELQYPLEVDLTSGSHWGK
jgi:DNA polymerase I-like protein with 3'-5' exonuclease and polymerase domains